MFQLDYKKYNTIVGWVVFAIALITYTLTLEPTVSYWDCGEYISTSVKLEVGHPPGAPLFQMLGAFFAMFTSDVTHIAKMVNFMSGLASAFTILFLFWTITALAKKIVLAKNNVLSSSQIIAILGSGVVGALTYTFSDSFWFSAVEAEVYAMSSFLMALLLWLGIRWEQEMDKPRGNKWLLLISFVVGLSFGVHILSLLVIPSVVFIYFCPIDKHVLRGSVPLKQLSRFQSASVEFKTISTVEPLTVRAVHPSSPLIERICLPSSSENRMCFLLCFFFFVVCVFCCVCFLLLFLCAILVIFQNNNFFEPQLIY